MCGIWERGGGEGSGRMPEGGRKSFFAKEIRIEKGSIVKELSDEYKEALFPYLLIDAINGGRLKYANPSGLSTCSKDDPLIVMDGSRSGLVLRGKAGIIGSTLAAILPKDSARLDKGYLYNVLTSFYGLLNGRRTSGAVPHVDRAAFLNLPFLLPPLHEQRKIAEILSSVDAAIEKTKAVIEQ